MRRFRLSTLMLLVVIVALVTAVLVQQIRLRRYEVERQASLAESRAMRAQIRLLANQYDILALQSLERAEECDRGNEGEDRFVEG
jgi:hypothetical protein